ncbi:MULTISPECIES: carboxylesterase family protein [unclassified Nonomuraea]|uniref:carboxylesterase/lipase family protein n=1 Tax=unclassified Nonomuraea TaxID=2593643 RepID=UPI0034044674
MRRLSTGLPARVTAALAALALIMSMCEAADARDPVAQTDLGLVRGVVEQGVQIYQGIPYAQPPTGARRWTLPVRPRPWTEARDARRPGPACAQLDEQGALAARSSEDCLYLNVTTPGGKPAGRRPVLVYLHGGAFSSGAGSDFDARRLAATGGVVVVSVNSRLGVFGFFGHPKLPGSGSYGLADQQAALRWVRANAASFGGDPRRVTLMGESSGGASVCAQLTSPQAAGLFHRAIIQSGSCLQRWPKNVMAPGLEAVSYWASRADIEARGTKAAGELGCAGARATTCLRSLDARKLLALNGRFTQPAYDTPVLPVDPAAALRSGDFHRVPVMQGNTRHEHRLFTRLFELERPIDDARYRELLTTTFGARQSRRVYAEYPPRAYTRGSTGADGAGSAAALAWAAVGTDAGWVCPTLTASKLLARQVPVYGFEFADPDVPDIVGLFPKGYPAGAYHGSELPMLFDIESTSITLSPAQRHLSAQMIRYWSTFAAAGDPNRAGLPWWRAYPSIQALDSAPRGISPVDASTAHHCRFWATAPKLDGGAD